MFFVEAKYHHNPKRAADQIRYIAQREEGLPNGERRELYGIGPRYRAFRGDEKAMRKVLVEDARGLRNPVYLRFILTVDTHTAEASALLHCVPGGLSTPKRLAAQRYGSVVLVDREAVFRTNRTGATGTQAASVRAQALGGVSTKTVLVVGGR